MRWKRREIMPKCHTCHHTRTDHTDWTGRCFWGRGVLPGGRGTFSGCSCNAFVYPPIPSRLSQQQTLKVIAARMLCLDLEVVKTVELSTEHDGKATRAIRICIELPIQSEKPIEEWMREKFPWDDVRFKAFW